MRVLGILGCILHMERKVDCRLASGVELGFRSLVVTMELMSANRVLLLVGSV